jgi:Flp pilus assembly protein TadG
MRRLRSFLGDVGGAALVETTLVFPLMLVLMFGLVEFGNVMWQYHADEKATSAGARYLATRGGVAGTLGQTLTTELYTTAVPDCFVTTTDAPGTPCSQEAGATGWKTTCSGTGGGACSSTEMSALLTEMQKYAPTITAANVAVDLRGSTMGYVGRGRAIPLITVRTTGLTYNWVAMGALLGLGPLTMPSFASTLPAEDQKEGPGI